MQIRFALEKGYGNFVEIGVRFSYGKVIDLHIEKLPEGVYPATSDSIQGLIAQGRTISETLEIARDVAKKLREAERK